MLILYSILFRTCIYKCSGIRDLTMYINKSAYYILKYIIVTVTTPTLIKQRDRALNLLRSQQDINQATA